MVERRHFDASRVGVNCNSFSNAQGTTVRGSNPFSPAICGSSSIGRAPAFQAGCCEFKSRLSLHRLSHGVVNSARIKRYIQQFIYNRTCNPQMTCNSSCLPINQVGGSSTVEQVYMYLENMDPSSNGRTPVSKTVIPSEGVVLVRVQAGLPYKLRQHWSNYPMR